MRRFHPVLATLVMLLALAGCGNRRGPEPILIGHLAPLSGPDGRLGRQARRGVELAVEEANADGKSVAGRPLEVLHADTRGERQAAEGEAVRLLTVNKVAALLTGPEPLLAAAEVRAAQPYGVPILVPGALADLPSGDEVFSLGATPAARGEALAHFASRDLKAARAAVVTDSRSPPAVALAEAFQKGWPRGEKAKIEEWTYEKEGDLAELKARVVGAKPDVVLIAGPVTDFRRLGGQLQGAGLHVPLLYGGPDVGGRVLQKGMPAGADVYLATAYCTDGLSARGKEFARRYEEKFHEPPGLAAAEAYDAARLLFETMQKVQSFDATRLRQELGKREPFAGVTGTVSWHERQPRRALFLVQVGEQGVKRVKTVEPAAR